MNNIMERFAYRAYAVKSYNHMTSSVSDAKSFLYVTYTQYRNISPAMTGSYASE